MEDWSAAYLDLIRKNPQLSVAEAARELGVEPALFDQRRRARKDVLTEERKIRAAFLAQQRVKKEDDGAEEDLPFECERYLYHFRQDPRRVESLRKMRAEGFLTTWDDVRGWMKEYPGFARVFGDVLDERTMEAYDNLDLAATKGSSWAVRMKLKAELPEKFGDRMRVDVNHAVQIEHADRRQIEEIKRTLIAPAPVRRQLKAQSPVEDVVDGEVVS